MNLNLFLHSRTSTDSHVAFKSLQTVGSLLLTNSDFRVFIADLQTVGREVFRDSAFAFSDAAKEIGDKVDPSEQSLAKVDSQAATTQDLSGDVKEVSAVLGNGASKVGKETLNSISEHFSGDERETMLNRLKRAILKLRERNDYSDSVSTIGLLIQRYAKVYSRAADDILATTEDDIDTNEELDRAVKNFWSLITSFGDRSEWEELEARFKQVASHRSKDPQFESLMNQFGTTVQKLLTDPDTLEHADEKISELRQKYNETGTKGSLRGDVNSAVEQLAVTLKSVLHDEDIAKLLGTSLKIFGILSPTHSLGNRDLFHDCINVFVPLFIQAIQYIPIPRLEISAPEVDLLLENLIVEPGVTVNNTSFLPFRMKIETYNDLEIRKARMRTVSKVTSLVTIKIDGISIRADEIGFWLRAHSGFLRLADEGIASVQLDERGLDIHIDVEIGEEKLEKILTLKDVRVHIHKLKYQLRKSKFSWLAWLVKPLLQPIVRKVVEKQLSNAIADFFHTANRELLYARERLRATRISDPKDLQTFFKAIMTRLTPDEDPDMYSRVGVAQPGKGVFKGVYAPGSVVKLWNEEAAKAPEIVDEYDRGGWRNDVFEVNTVPA